MADFYAEYIISVSPATARLLFDKLRARVEPVHSPNVECAIVVFNSEDADTLIAECKTAEIECVKVK